MKHLSFRCHIHRDQRDWRTAGKHRMSRLRIQTKICIFQVARHIEYAAHNNDIFDRVNHLRVKLQGNGHIGEWTGSNQCDLTRVITDEFTYCLRRMGGHLLTQCRGRNLRPELPQAELIDTMIQFFTPGLRIFPERTRGATVDRNRNIQLRNEIFRDGISHVYRRVSCDSGDHLQSDLRRGDRQRQRQAVIDIRAGDAIAWIAVNYDPHRCIFTLSRVVLYVPGSHTTLLFVNKIQIQRGEPLHPNFSACQLPRGPSYRPVAERRLTRGRCKPIHGLR